MKNVTIYKMINDNTNIDNNLMYKIYYFYSL